VGDEYFHDDKVWEVKRVIKTIGETVSKDGSVLFGLLKARYGQQQIDRLLHTVTPIAHEKVPGTQILGPPPEIKIPVGKPERLIYILLQGHHS
jgi:hypothetical protein